MCKRNTFKQEIEVYMSTYEKVLYLQSIQGNYTPLMANMNYYALPASDIYTKELTLSRLININIG
jgi:hypothetical protein